MLPLLLSLAAGCFTQHIDEAIADGEAALVTHQETSGGASVPLSLQILGIEHAMIPLAKALDASAEAHGVTERWCSVFVPSLATAEPTVSPHTPTRTSVTPHVSMGAMLWQHATAQDLARIDALTKNALADMVDPGRDCMTRHVLEAMEKTAHIAAQHPDGRSLFVTMMLLQATSIPGALQLDARARPLQESGVPIVCADVASIL